MKLKITNLLLALILSSGFVGAQGFFTTDGTYAIQNVGRSTFIVPGSATGPGVSMSATGTAKDFQWIVRKNAADGNKYNILTVDEQLLLGGDGTQGRLYDNTETKRNDATGGALITFVEVSTGTRFEVPDGTGTDVFNGNRTGGQFVGMGADRGANGTWNLIRVQTWTGATSTAWDVAGNWSDDVVPTAGSYVIIPDVSNKPVIASGSIEVQGLDLADAAMLTVSTGASLSVTGDLAAAGTGHVEVWSGGSLLTSGSVTGTSHVFKRTTTFDSNTGQYSVIGSPVAGASTSSLGGLVYSYDETVAYGSDGSTRFSQVTSPETMTGGDAYFSAFTGEVTFTGTPHTGNVTVPLQYDANDGGNAGFNLVSNPYPAAISYLELIKAANNPDISGTVYIWDDGGSESEKRTNADYITVNMVGEVGSEVATATGGSGRSGDWNGYIGSAQGFFVKATGASTNLNFNNGMKVTGNNASANYFRTAEEAISEIQSVKFSLSNADGFSNQSLVGFVDNATGGFDRLYDAHKFDGANGVKLYSLLGESPMAIQGLPIADESIIPLGLSVDVAGEYTLKIENVANLSEGKFIYLEDTQLGKITQLEKGGQYSFSAQAGIDESRFNLIVSNAMGVLALDDLDKQGLNVLYNQRGLILSSSDVKISQAQVSILDLSGAMLFNERVENLNTKEVIDFEFSSNKVYVLRVTTGANSFVTKIAFD